MVKILTQEIIDFIMANYKGNTVPELAKMLEKEFNQEFDAGKLRSWLKDRHLSNGVDTRLGSPKFKEIHEKKFKKKYVQLKTITQTQRYAEEFLRNMKNS